MSHIITQGMRSPFLFLENIDAYDFYKATFLIASKKPRSRDQFKDDNFKLFERAQKNAKKIINKAKKYKCYAL